MQQETIKISGYSIGDGSVGIGSIDFEINTGLMELSKEDKEYIIKNIIRDIWELHDNGDLRFDFSDEMGESDWDFKRRFTYEDSKNILDEVN